ncbi:MAG: DUF4381 domain-containing protein [Rhodanobacter sp.]
MMTATGQPAAAASVSGPSLRDIHLPAEPSWWPPAPGWWLLAALVLLVIAAAGWAWRRHRRLRGRERQILGELDHLVRQHRDGDDPDGLLRDLHQLLRRVARRHDPLAIRQRGDAWRRTLARVPVDSVTLERLGALDELIYQAPAVRDDEMTVAAVRTWLRVAVKPSKWKAAAPGKEADDA